MKKSYLLFLFFSLFSLAQGGMNMGGGMGGGQRPSVPPPGNPPGQKDSAAPKMSVDEQLAFLKENLNLDELQELLIREELIDEEKKRSTASFNTNISAEAMQEKMEAEKKKKEEKFQKILSEEQFQKWKELGNNFQKGNKPHKQNAMDIFRAHSADLNLSEEQQNKIDAFANPENFNPEKPFSPQEKEKEFEELLKSTLDKKQYKNWKKILKEQS